MRIKTVRTSLYDIPPQVERTDAIQAFVSMEFPFIEIEDVDGIVGTGFSYTIGKGGAAIKQIMDAYLTPILLEEDAANIDRIWNSDVDGDTLGRQRRDRWIGYGSSRYCFMGSDGKTCEFAALSAPRRRAIYRACLQHGWRLVTSFRR